VYGSVIDYSCISKFKGPCGAGLNTQRVSLAQFTFNGFLGVGIQLNHPHGAVFDTQTAADTFIRVDEDNAAIPSPNGVGRAYIHAIGIFTLITDHRHMIEVFIFVKDQKAGPPGVISSDQVHAAGQLADAAACTFVKVCVNKGFDGFLPLKISIH
jgi:hypothetical protein